MKNETQTGNPVIALPGVDVTRKPFFDPKLRAPFGYPGGKSLMRDELEKEIPPDHKFFGTVFGGAGWLLIGKQPSHSEAFNDLSGDLINFFRVVQTVPEEFVLSLQWDLASRETFNEFKKKMQDPNGELTNLERARMFFYIIKTSFGSMSETFGTSTTGKPRLNFGELRSIICSIHHRFQRVTIENLTWKEFILRYDRDYTVFDIDPPYHIESAKDFYRHYLVDDFIDLARTLKNIKGRFIMTLNDDVFVRKTFEGFILRPIHTRYSVCRQAKPRGRKVQELLIKNF